MSDENLEYKGHTTKSTVEGDVIKSTTEAQWEKKQDGVIFTPKVEDDMGRIDEFPNIEELDSEDKIIAVTPKVDVRSVRTPEELGLIAEEIKAEVESEVESEVEIEGKLMEGIEPIDLNKKNYTKITPTLYVKPVESDAVDDKGEKIQIYDILNPETQTVETRELTGEEKREIQILRIKESHIKFRPIKHGVIKSVVVGETDGVYGRKKKQISTTVITNVTTNRFDAEYRKKRQRKNKMQKASRRLAHKK